MPPAVLRCKAYLFFKGELSALVALRKRKFHGLKLLRTLRAYAACCPAAQEQLFVGQYYNLKYKFLFHNERIIRLSEKRRLPVFFCFVSFVVVADKVFALFSESFD